MPKEISISEAESRLGSTLRWAKENQIAYGIHVGADYLVTGDGGLLALQRVNTLKIVDPVDFLPILQDADKRG